LKVLSRTTLTFDKPVQDYGQREGENGLDEQADLMKKYVVFKKKTHIKKLLFYTVYFRLNRYKKYLLSLTNIIKAKLDQELLFEVYPFDVELRKLLFNCSKKDG